MDHLKERKGKDIWEVMVNSDGTTTTPKLGYSYGTPRSSLAVPTVEHLFRGSSEGSRSLGLKSPTNYRERDAALDHEGQDFQNKSVIAKVKDRARKWRQNLGKKKGVDVDHEDGMWSGTGTGKGMSPGEDNLEEEEEDAEYLGAPMYESAFAPVDCREHARQHPRANPVIAENHILPNSPRQADPRGMNSSTRSAKTVAVSRSLPNRDATAMMQGQTIGPRLRAASANHADIRVAKQNCGSAAGSPRDNGISMREYLAQKLKPGEDGMALSRAITSTMSPRKAGTTGDHPHEPGIVEKVKDAVSSLLHTGDSSSASSGNSYLASRPAPVSATAQEVEEESHGRILQTN